MNVTLKKKKKKKKPGRWLGEARSESPARGSGAVYSTSQGSCETVAGGGDGALVAAAPRCASFRAFVLCRAMRNSRMFFLELLDHHNFSIKLRGDYPICNMRTSTHSKWTPDSCSACQGGTYMVWHGAKTAQTRQS